MAYFSLDCRYTPELGTKNAPPGVGNKRGKTNFFFKNETHRQILWALPASLRNFKSIHALVWSAPASEIWHFFCAKLAKLNCGAVKLIVELQIGISQRIMHLFSRGQKPRLDNFVVLLPKKKFYAKNGRKMAYFSLDCRYTPGLGTKSAPPGEGRKR